MKKTILRESTDDSTCCDVCKHFYDVNVYGAGECAKHTEICAYCDCVCDEFQPKYYGDDDSRAE